MYPYLTLLIIPVVRGVFLNVFYGKGTLSGIIIAECIVLSLAVLTAVLKLKRTQICFNGEITVEKGLFCRVHYSIPESADRVIVLESNPILKVCGALRLKIYTEAGNRKKPDENILITRKAAVLIFEKYRVEGHAVRSNTFGEVIMSAALSSFLNGILLTIPTVKIIMSLLGQNIQSLMPTAKDLYFQGVNFSTVGRWITVLLGIGYIVSFFVLFLRNLGFYSVKSGTDIMLDSGRLPHRIALLKAKSVYSVRTVTAPLMLLLRKCAVKYSACGYGRLKGEIGLLVPCVNPTLAKGLVQWLLPEFKSGNLTLTPDKKAYRRIIWLPLLLVSGAVIGLIITKLYFYGFWNFSLLIASGLLICAVVLFLMRCSFVKNGGISVTSEQISAQGIKGFSLDKLQLKISSVQYIKISRTPFDRRHGHCMVKLRATGKNRDTVKVKYLNYYDCLSLLEKSCRQ